MQSNQQQQGCCENMYPHEDTYYKIRPEMLGFAKLLSLNFGGVRFCHCRISKLQEIKTNYLAKMHIRLSIKKCNKKN